MRILRKLNKIHKEIISIMAEATMKTKHAMSAKKKNLRKYPLSVKHLRIRSATNQMSTRKVKILIGRSMNLGKKKSFTESLIMR